MPAAQVFSEIESAETLKFSQSNAAKLVLREFIGYEPYRIDQSYNENTFMPTVQLHICVQIMVRFLKKSEKNGKHRQKQYGDTYARI